MQLNGGANTHGDKSVTNLFLTPLLMSPKPSRDRFSCLTAPIQLPGLTSNCQNIDAAISLSFNIQRFSASDTSTCASYSPVYNVSSVIELKVQASKATVSSDSAPSPAATAASYDTSYATANSASSSRPPAVLAVFQLQLDLSGIAGTAWMDTLSGSGQTSDVQILGHDVGLLVALTGSTCDATEIAIMFDSLSVNLNSLGGVIRSWSCLPGPTYGNISESQVIEAHGLLHDSGFTELNSCKPITSN